MKQIRKQWLAFYQKALGGLLVMLGFSGCDNIGADMYGTPPVDYFTIKGSVKDEAGSPVTSAKVIVRDLRFKEEALYTMGSTEYDVNENGEYLIERTEYDYMVDFRVVAKDAAHESDSVEVSMKSEPGSNLAEETVNFTLKKK